MIDPETIAVYDARAADYADRIGKEAAPQPQADSFLSHLPETADILDLGCGPGTAAAYFAQAGHRVTATDASASMIDMAARHEGVTARQETFSALTGTGIYDGIWANFSLLHAERAALPNHLQAIATALRPGGIFHIGMKLGHSSTRDRLGRRYTFVMQDELTGLLTDVGLTPVTHWTGSGVGFAGTDDPWIVMQARKNA
ncbi:class I SAM-dependent DNA methyltransferase [Aestuariivita boseongensis]|uniref:class I SAM-dependent DNA methyltransferase n=1 Tax=Aestuariivita boseongensis TaxID=1470562 RepID=UPI000680DA99|nr:class I SAM-dependent methyltransferase [Aestuariivita boseongensis]